jgi:HK97 gp10 family phage protein
MKIPGADKMLAQLKRLENLNIVPTKLAVLKKIYDESQRLVPVDEGDLKASGKYDENAVSYGTDHALYPEFGTIHQRPQPYLRPAYENNREELIKIAVAELNKSVKEAVK